MAAPVSTLYFGGGTPSLFSPSFFSAIIDFFDQENGFSAVPELTLEANPADIHSEQVKGYLQAGINRISLGAQTFIPAGLRRLGRRHDAFDIYKAFTLLRKAGFGNISLDLIYAWPGQSLDDLLFDLNKTADLAPEHVSAYILSYEPGCAITKDLEAGKIVPVGEGLQLKMMRLLEDSLDKAGLCRYEVSNFSRSRRFQSQHNLAYWQLKDFVGLGAGACGGRRLRQDYGHWVERYCNISDPYLYMQHLIGSGCQQPESGRNSALWSLTETVDLGGAFTEALMMGLRLRRGVDLTRLRAEYGSVPVAAALAKAEALRKEKLVDFDQERFWITAEGLYLTDSIISRLV